MWENDLNVFLEELTKYEKKLAQDNEDSTKQKKSRARKDTMEIEPEKSLFNIKQKEKKVRKRKKKNKKKSKLEPEKQEIIEDFKATLGISYLDVNSKKQQKLRKKNIATLSVKDSILKYLNRPLISSIRGNLSQKKKSEMSLAERL